jgi:hypothetical protein
MGEIVITSINRNPGATSQEYRIEYRQVGALDWIIGPTLNWAQAVTAMPLGIAIPDAYMDSDVEIRIVTVCGKGVEAIGEAVIVPIAEQEC